MAENQRAEIVNIKSTKPLEILCIDILALEKSKGDLENVLVITDYFTYMQWQDQLKSN